MLPGLTLTYQCPQCLYRFDVSQGGSGFGPFVEVWSDGYVEGVYSPPEMLRCGHCLEMFWVKHLEPVFQSRDGFAGRNRFSMFPSRDIHMPEANPFVSLDAPPISPRLQPEKHFVPVRIPIDSRLENAIEAMPETRFLYMREGDYAMVISIGFWQHEEDELQARMWYWQKINHFFRNQVQEKNDPTLLLTAEKYKAYIQNLERMLSLLKPGNPNHRPLLRAEMWRNLSQFEVAMKEAEQALSTPKWSIWESERTAILEHCRNQNPFPFVFP